MIIFNLNILLYDGIFRFVNVLNHRFLNNSIIMNEQKKLLTAFENLNMK